MLRRSGTPGPAANKAKYRTLVEQIPAIASAASRAGQPAVHQPAIAGCFLARGMAGRCGGLLKQIHPEERARGRAEIARSYASGEPLRCEYPLLTRAGEARWFLNEASLVRGEAGEPLFLQGVLVDITEDKQVEEELRLHRHRLEELVARRTAPLEKQATMLESANANLASELNARAQAESALQKYADQLADLYNNAPCGYHSLDPGGVFVQIYDTELAWLGRTREEVVGKMRFADLLAPASGQAFEESYPGFKERGWARDLEFEIARTDGTRLCVLLNATAIKDAAGRFVMSRSTMFDITDRKRVEQALRASEERFRRLLESAGEGIYGLDTAGRTFVNDAALKMLGYARRNPSAGRPTNPSTTPAPTGCRTSGGLPDLTPSAKARWSTAKRDPVAQGRKLVPRRVLVVPDTRGWTHQRRGARASRRHRGPGHGARFPPGRTICSPAWSTGANSSGA